MHSLSHVGQPIQIGPTQIANRIVDPARSLFYSTDYLLSDRHMDFYRERARGGAGLIITEQQAAHPVGKGSFFRSCVAYDPRAIPRYAQLAELLHEHGTRVFVQLYTPGVHDTGTMVMDEWHPIWGASLTISDIHRRTPVVMGRNEIASVVAGYAQSAGNVLSAGADGVEIHAAHGYQLAQFLSPYYNRRDDEYGGSVENRCRLVIEVARAIREAVGNKITVGVRLSYDEFRGSAGLTADESDQQVALFDETGLFDYFNISGGGYGTFHLSTGSMRTPQGHMADFGRRAKAIVGDRAAVFIVGRIKSIEMADQLIADGFADMVCMSRAQLADPFVVKKALAGKTDEIRRCIGINRCISRLAEQREVSCALNPATGRERALGVGTLKPAARPRKIAVVGAGPAGLRAAATLGARGHHVTLYERERAPGGHIQTIARLPMRAEWLEAVEDLVAETRRSHVDLRLATPVDHALVEKIDADLIVIATGSAWDGSGFSGFRPHAGVPPGLDRARSLPIDTAIDAEVTEPGALGDRVLIVDESGSSLPFSLAELLVLRGARVDIYSPHAIVSDELVRTQEIGSVMPLLRRAGVGVYPNLAIDRVEGGRVHFRDVWSGEDVVVVGVSTIVLSMLRVSRDTSAQIATDRETIVVGDAVTPRDIAEVIYESEVVARSI